MRNLFRAVMLGALIALPVQAQQKWADIKGRVTWAGGKAPKRKEIEPQRCKLPADKAPLLDQTYVINPKNKGVQWVQVYVGVADAAGKVDPEATVPIHPSLKDIKDKKVVIDQPCCAFEPHVLGLRSGQSLVVKNSSTDAHNSNVGGDGVRAPKGNPLLPAGAQFEFPKPWVPHHFPIQVGCAIHPWMKAYVRVFNHPYHTVTDKDGNFELKNVPVGANVRLVFWHEEEGWFVGDFRNGMKLKAPNGDGVIDLGEVKMIPEDE